jgi:hypothetical protein
VLPVSTAVIETTQQHHQSLPRDSRQRPRRSLPPTISTVLARSYGRARRDDTWLVTATYLHIGARQRAPDHWAIWRVPRRRGQRARFR